MNSRTCNNCGAEVNDSLVNCSKCGVPLQDSNRSYKKVILFVLIIFNIIMLAWALSGIGGAAEIGEGSGVQTNEDSLETSTVFGGSMIAIIWVVGDIVFGFLYFMSGKKR